MNDTLTAEELSSITGLTDRRHRQLAKEGWFPEPTRGTWATLPTLQGILKYYRDAQATGARGALTAARIAESEERTRHIRVQRLERENKLVPVIAIQAVWADIILTVRSLLLNNYKVPQDVAIDILQKMQEGVSENLVRDALERVKQPLAELELEDTDL